MYNKVLLIYNGNAGQSEVERHIQTVAGALAGKVEELTLKRTKQKGHAEEICRERGEEVDLVCILGGDGTVHECINGLASLANPPVIAILPGGTCNDFSRSLGISQNMKQAANTILIDKKEKVDIMKVNDRWVTNFVGLGLITDASQNIDPNLKGTFGRLSYFISAIKTVRESKPFSFTMETSDGGEIQDHAVMILVANGNYLGTNQLPSLHENMNDGNVNVFVLREAGMAVLKEFIQNKDLNEWDMNNEAFDFMEANELTITTDHPMELDMDGEVYNETPVRIRLYKEHLTFITGEEYNEN
ncbi:MULTISPECIES: diacylglycerol/lipid kinase family protein [Alteribacter]|uniref:Diacylglycerol kinase family lipid kinase n=1 Tax=Alteribacter keqinensis TaxID=2483800 RepID=A0A3M7TN61_9BACI|nr:MULTISPECIES: diacylglycerol kinase family protein [Alteribacter]MBM7095035.1 diacylglycerol kinase family lipid kinase [Alteribacter salitolerans]RNA66828.1 diacylglycerol kinase family lipid kinase [Alteribacter keqinensis]